MMKEVEWAIYNEWFNLLTKRIGEDSDGFIYMRTTPGTCLKRLQKRARSEEKTVDLDYLQQIHERHEEWLNPKDEKQNSNVLILECDEDFEKNEERQKIMVKQIEEFVIRLMSKTEEQDKENQIQNN
jgi:deoxyadenosine/deoxycytidine kinase